MSLLQALVRRIAAKPVQTVAQSKPLPLSDAQIKTVSGRGPNGTWLSALGGPNGSW